MLQSLLEVVPVKGELDRLALAAHATMLEHGFVCAGAADADGAAAARQCDDGSVTLQVLPPGWNGSGSGVPDSYAFRYMHPLRGAAEAFTLKAVAMGDTLAVHAASSVPGGDLLSLNLKADSSAPAGEASVAAAARLRPAQDKMAETLAIRLLGRHNSTSRLGKALDPSALAAAETAGQKRPAPEGDRGRQPVPTPAPMPPERPGLDPFFFPVPGRGTQPHLPPWTPDGGLIGPRHPAWGQPVPVGPHGGGFPGSGTGGFLPRFDPIGPGMGELDPDHLRTGGTGLHPDIDPLRVGGRGFHPDFPADVQGGRGGGRRGFDPFMM